MNASYILSELDGKIIAALTLKGLSSPKRSHVVKTERSRNGRKSSGDREDPLEGHLTIRRRIAEMLRETELTARDISRILGISEKEVYEHLPHIERSEGPGTQLIAEPARCLRCGFVFTKRTRFTAPGRCPVCRSESISEPVYGIRTHGKKRTTIPEEEP